MTNFIKSTVAGVAKVNFINGGVIATITLAEVREVVTIILAVASLISTIIITVGNLKNLKKQDGKGSSN